eukprot:sb/3478444/
MTARSLLLVFLTLACLFAVIDGRTKKRKFKCVNKYVDEVDGFQQNIETGTCWVSSKDECTIYKVEEQRYLYGCRSCDESKWPCKHCTKGYRNCNKDIELW